MTPKKRLTRDTANHDKSEDTRILEDNDELAGPSHATTKGRIRIKAVKSRYTRADFPKSSPSKHKSAVPSKEETSATESQGELQNDYDSSSDYQPQSNRKRKRQEVVQKSAKKPSIDTKNNKKNAPRNLKGSQADFADMQRQYEEKLQGLEQRLIEQESEYKKKIHGIKQETARQQSEYEDTIHCVKQEATKRHSAYEEEVHNLEQEASRRLSKQLDLQNLASISAGQVSDLRGKLEQANCENKTLRAAVEKVRLDAIELHDSTIKVTSQAPKVGDNFICEKWNNVDYAIRNLASTVLTVTPKEVDKSKTRTAIVTIIEICEANPRPDMQSFLLQRYLWMVIYYKILQAKENIWAGVKGERFVGICRTLRDEYRDDPKLLSALSNWKAETSCIHNESYKVNNVAVAQVVAETFRNLSIFMDEDGLKIAKSDIEHMFHYAIELMETFITSRAFFEVSAIFLAKPPLDAPIPFDKQLMEPDRGCLDDAMVSKMRARIVISPPLTKTGNADGENMGHSIVLCRGRVELVDT